MKCLLLLLASGLVTSDKLDRTYLPPPGAKFSGGTHDDLYPPLEFPKETRTGSIVNANLAGSYPTKTFTGVSANQDIGKEETVPIDYSTSTLPNLSETTLFPNNGYHSTMFTSRPKSSFYGSLPSKSLSPGYLPSKNSIDGAQSYKIPDPVPRFNGISSTNGFRPTLDQKDTGYYYFLPALQRNRDNMVNFIPDNNNNNNAFAISGINHIPNQINIGHLLGNEPHFIPRAVTTNEIVQNYQPSAFRYYGGNPMIMASQNSLPQDLGSMELTSKFGSNESSVPGFNQEKYKKTSARPFQTPFVRPNAEAALKPTDSQTTTNNYDEISLQLPTTTTRTFNEKIPTSFVQRNGIMRSKLRKERPQTKFERSSVISNYDNNISQEGYAYSYDTSNGIHVDETGITTNGVRAKGSYSYTGDDGKVYTVTYTADENGFQPRGDHLPTAPPIPKAIQSVIDQAARDKAAGIIDDGLYDEKKYGHMNYQGAMDRYNLFKKSGNKGSRLNDIKKKPNKFILDKNDAYLQDVPLYNSIVSKTNDQAYENLNTLPSVRGGNTSFNETYLQGNRLNGANRLSTGSKSSFERNNPNKEHINDEYGKPIISLNDNQIIDEDKGKISQIQNVNIKNKYKPINGKADVSNTDIQDQISQKYIPSTISETTFKHDGYYYVPPIIKFNTNTEIPAFKKNAYLTTTKPTPETISTEVIKRTEFDESQRANFIDEVGRSSQMAFNLNGIGIETTRQPYISGPDEQKHDKQIYEQSQSNLSLENDTNIPAVNKNNLKSLLYNLNTTPMTTQAIRENQAPDGYSEYYQSTSTPNTFDQTLPSTVESRLNIPSANPGITVSQDFVTTTYRPFISGDGVLEVNQNVKIYGLGKPETNIAFSGYPKKYPDNNIFYSTTPNGETIIEDYPNNFNTRPVQDTAVFQEMPGSMSFGNEYFSTGIPGNNYGKTNGLYNSGFNRVPQGDPGIEPTASIFNANPFETPEQIPNQEVTTPIIANKNQGPKGKIIGEDFSGPKI